MCIGMRDIYAVSSSVFNTMQALTTIVTLCVSRMYHTPYEIIITLLSLNFHTIRERRKTVLECRKYVSLFFCVKKVLVGIYTVDAIQIAILGWCQKITTPAAQTAMLLSHFTYSHMDYSLGPLALLRVSQCGFTPPLINRSPNQTIGS